MAFDFGTNITDPQVQAIINALASGQFSPQDASTIATQLQAPTLDASIPGGQPDPGSTFLTPAQYSALLPYIGSLGFSGADPVPTFTPGSAEAGGQPVFLGFGGPDNSPMWSQPATPGSIDSGTAGTDLQYLISHGFASGSQPDAGGPDPFGFVTSFGLGQIGREIGGGTGTAADVLGTVGQIGGSALLGTALAGGVGNAIGTGAGIAEGAGGVAEGAAAGGTLGEAGTSLAGGEIAAGGGGAAEGAVAGGSSAIPGGSLGLLDLATGGEGFSTAPSGVSVLGQSAPVAGGFNAGLGAGFGAGAAAGAGSGPGGGASGASSLEGGGTFSGTATDPTQATSASGTFGNLGASNPITGAAPDASTTGATTATGTPTATGSPAFDPTTGVTGSPGSATGTTMDFTSPALSVANSALSDAPAGMDAIAAQNFAAENTANPALSATLDNTGISGGAGPAPGGGFGASDIMKFLKSNPNLILGGVGLGAAAANKPSLPNMGNLNAEATAANNTANSLINAETSGQLPPGQQQMVQNALNDTISGIRAKYANMGLSGSSSEQQEIAAARERAAATTADLATKVTGQGLNALGLAEQIYATIAQLKLGQDQGLQQAIANFAGAAAGGAGGQLVKSLAA